MARLLAVPSGWVDVLGRTLTTAVVAFATLMVKEWIDAGLDVPGCAIDAAWVGGGAFLLNAMLTWMAKPAREAERKRALTYG